jgi:hypothetical protein
MRSIVGGVVVVLSVAVTASSVHAGPTEDALLCGVVASGRAASTIVDLIKKGANPNATCTVSECVIKGCKNPSPVNAPALYFASRDDAIDSVRALLENGADPNSVETAYGDTPLFNIRSAAVADLLFTHGAKPEIRNRRGSTALNQLPVRIGNMWFSLKPDQAVMLAKVLVAHGADVDAANPQGTTPLMYAIAAGHPALVQALVDLHANVNARNADGATALAIARKFENIGFQGIPEVYRTIQGILRAHGAIE